MKVHYVMGGGRGREREEKRRGIYQKKKNPQNPTTNIQLLLILKVKLKL